MILDPRKFAEYLVWKQNAVKQLFFTIIKALALGFNLAKKIIAETAVAAVTRTSKQ